jgi:hypothetical protein
MVRKLFLSIFFILVILPLWGQTSPFAQSSMAADSDSFPENNLIRRQLSDWFFDPVNEVAATVPRVYSQIHDGSLVKVRSEVTDEAVYHLFLNQRDFIYPVAGRGSVIVKRDKREGSFIQMKVFLDDGADTFLRIFPFQERTSLEVYLQGKRISTAVSLPLSFNQVLTSPVSELKELTGNRVPWDLFEPQPQRRQDRDLESLVLRIRQELSRLEHRDDGAMAEDGSYVYIETLSRQEAGGGLNCSGFAKWVIDGFAVPILGSPLPLEPLKEKHLSSRGNSLSFRYEDSRDPFFGLDWTRNLAVALARLRGSVPTGIEAFDVRGVPYFPYVEDVGYPVKDLSPLLYVLARENPGYFYLASINQPFGTDPPIRQHTHVALLFPYLNGDGRLQIEVFETTEETSLKSLENRYPDDFAHLVRIPVEGSFYLP